MLQRFHSSRPGMRNKLSYHFGLSTFLASLLMVSPGLQAVQQDRLTEFKEKYEHESDPVRKAKALTKLGDLQVSEFVRQANANNVDAAFTILMEYRAEVRASFDGLKATGLDAERKPDGFKDLQIHLRKATWELDRAAPLVPGEKRAAFQDIRDELNRIHNDLIHRLFPREPGAKRSGEK
jgi:hypothetical protein